MKVRDSAALSAGNPARAAVGGIGVSVLNSPRRLKLLLCFYGSFFSPFVESITGYVRLEYSVCEPWVANPDSFCVIRIMVR